MNDTYIYTIDQGSRGSHIAEIWDSITGARIDFAVFTWPPLLRRYRHVRARKWARERAMHFDRIPSAASATTAAEPVHPTDAAVSVQARACNTRQLISDLCAIAAKFDGAKLEERITGAVEQFVAASSAANLAPNGQAPSKASTAQGDGETRCDGCGWRTASADYCGNAECPHTAQIPASMPYGKGHHERYVTGYNDGLTDMQTALTVLNNGAAKSGHPS
jgi:hypothetical protein